MAQLNWIGKTYKILWNHFHNQEWRIEDAEKILSDRPRETIRNIISRLSKEGLISSRSDPENTRRSIYKLKPQKNEIQIENSPASIQKQFVKERPPGIVSSSYRMEMKKRASQDNCFEIECCPKSYEPDAQNSSFYISSPIPHLLQIDELDYTPTVKNTTVSVARLFHDTVENIYDFDRMIEFIWIKKQVETEPLISDLTFQDLFFYEENSRVHNFAVVLESKISVQLNTKPSWKLAGFCESLSETIQRRGTYGSRYLLHILEHFFSGPKAAFSYPIFSEIIASLIPKISPPYIFTHPSIIELIIKIIRPLKSESIYDPACGYGQFLFAADYFGNQGTADIKSQDNRFFGEVFISLLDFKAWRVSPHIVAMLANLLNNTQIRLVEGDSLLHPGFAKDEKPKTFSIALTYPPTNLRGYDEEALKKGDIWWRFRYGFPGKRSAEWGFVQHALASLNNCGRAALLLPGDALTRRGPDKDIRMRLIPEGCIDCIILLPAELTTAKDNSALLILKKNQKGQGNENILFIDARKECEKQWDDSGVVTITGEQAEKIANIYHNRTSIPDLSRTVPVQELLLDEGNLSVALFINPIKESEPETERTGWEMRRLGDFSTGATAGLPINTSTQGNEYKSLTALAISKEGTILSSRLKKTGIVDIAIKDKYLLQKNDLVIVVRDTKKGRGMIKKTLLYNGLPRDLVFSSELWRIRVTSPDILPEFLYLVLNMYKNKRFNFSVQEFSEKNKVIFIPCPPLPLQKEIIDVFKKNPSLNEFIDACIKPFMVDLPSSR